MSEPTLVSTLARDWRVDVDTGTTETPVWTQVRAITSFTPTVSATTQDDSDYDSDGWGSDAITMRKWSLTMTVGRKEQQDQANDPGQEALREASDQFGPAAVVHVRWYEKHKDDGEAYEGYALVNWEPQGGDTTSLKTVNVTLMGQGVREVITNPTGTP